MDRKRTRIVMDSFSNVFFNDDVNMPFVNIDRLNEASEALEENDREKFSDICNAYLWLVEATKMAERYIRETQKNNEINRSVALQKVVKDVRNNRFRSMYSLLPNSEKLHTTSKHLRDNYDIYLHSFRYVVGYNILADITVNRYNIPYPETFHISYDLIKINIERFNGLLSLLYETTNKANEESEKTDKIKAFKELMPTINIGKLMDISDKNKERLIEKFNAFMFCLNDYTPRSMLGILCEDDVDFSSFTETNYSYGLEEGCE